jgi:colicin import membrane protein
MPRIKVFTANLGFYEAAVAARSQKMALAHWGVSRDLFHEGTAKETNEPKAVEAAMRKVGMVVRRPIGSTGSFEERANAEQTLLKTLSRSRKPATPAKKTPGKGAKEKAAPKKR